MTTDNEDAGTVAPVPDDIVTQCPQLQAVVRVAVTCERCIHFGGVGVTNKDERIAWHQRHLILCGYQRRLPAMVMRG